MTAANLARILRAAAAECDAIAAEQASHAERAPSDGDLLTLPECGVSRRTLRSAIKKGSLPASKVGREYRVRRADLSSWLGSKNVKPQPVSLKKTTMVDRALERALRAGTLRVVGGSR